jgi:hypothetical protein
MSILQKITARAKQIRKAHPLKKWTDCIKQASREMKGKTAAPKKKAARRKVNRQTGSSNLAVDKKLPARKPGKRLSKSGKVYYERRKNRSDVPGKLAGVPASSLKRALSEQIKSKLGKEHVKKDMATTKTAKKKHQKIISSLKCDLRKLK